MMRRQDALIPIHRLQTDEAEDLDTERRTLQLAEQVIVTVQTTLGVMGLPVDEIIGEQQVVLKPLQGQLQAGIQGGAGCALMSSGEIAIALDVENLVQSVRDTTGRVIGTTSLGEDVTERKRAEEQAARLSAIVESSNDIIISKTLDGIVATWNKGAEEIYGYTKHEMIGKPISILLPPGREDEMPPAA